jgi:hypothetical protein
MRDTIIVYANSVARNTLRGQCQEALKPSLSDCFSPSSVSFRQFPSVSVSFRQFPSVCVSFRQFPSVCVSFRQFASVCVSCFENGCFTVVLGPWTVSVLGRQLLDCFSFGPSVAGLFQFWTVSCWTVSVLGRQLLDCFSFGPSVAGLFESSIFFTGLFESEPSVG